MAEPAEHPTEYSVEQIRAMRQGNIGRMFLRAHRAYNTRATTLLRERGHEGLNLAHTALLANLDIEGTHITTLAARAGMTKQSMGQLVAELEEQGYVKRESDPTDKRASVVMFTERGWQFLRDAYEVKLQLEAEYATLLGKENLDTLYDLLSRLVEMIDKG